MQPMSSTPVQGSLPIGGDTERKVPPTAAERTYGKVGQRTRLELLVCPICGHPWHVGGMGSGTGFVAAAADAHVRSCSGWNAQMGLSKRRSPAGRSFRRAPANATLNLFGAGYRG